MTIEMKSIYEKHKENFDMHASMGRPSVVEASKRFSFYPDMERAIGYTSSTVKKWADGGNISNASERMAAAWMNGQKSAATAPAQPETSADMFLVIPPAGSADKVRRVLAMLGCEFEVV